MKVEEVVVQASLSVSLVPPRILVVEDDEDHAALLHRWLTNAGFVVVVERDGLRGAAAARDGGFEAVVSDVQLPTVSGMLVVHESKSGSPNCPVIVTTAATSREAAIEALREGADDYFVKPIVRSVFVARVHELVVASRARRSKSKRTVLAIGAHPDDVEIGIGGALLRHVALGDRVVLLTLTGGEHGGGEDARRIESLNAANTLGAELIMDSLPDTRVSEGPETVSAISAVIARTAPEIVYTHTRHENHQDHRNVALASLVACRNVPNVFCYQSPSSNLDFRPGRFIDVSSYLDAKLVLLRAFASQTSKRAYLDDATIRASANYWGRFAGYRMVEPLEVVRAVE